MSFDINNTSCVLLLALITGFQSSLFAQSGFGEENLMVEVSGSIRDSDLADIDGDGDLDILFYNNNIAWVANNGYGTFGERTKINSEGDTRRYDFVSAADMDNDGDLDVVGASTVFNRLIYYINTGDGTFEEVEYEITNTPATSMTSLLTVDIDNDGDIDVIETALQFSPIGLYENDGAGNMSDRIEIFNTDSRDLKAVDVNLDGNLDLVSAADRSDKVAVYINEGGQGDASFPTEEVLFSGKTYDAIDAADIDGDQFPDIISGADDKIYFYPSEMEGLLMGWRQK